MVVNITKKKYNPTVENEMRIKVLKKIDMNLPENEIKIVISSNCNNMNFDDFVAYVRNYNNKLIVHNDYENLVIAYKDIMFFYSENKNNYCKTINGIYRIKSKLYELENNKDFIRISKRCIVNINYVKSFDAKQTGKIIVRMCDGTEEKVSRRRLRNVLNYLESRNL